MATTFKIGSGKGVYIYIAFAPERPFSFFIPVNNTSGHPYTLYGKRVINQPFSVARLYLKSLKITFGNGDKRCIIFVKNFHTVQQHKACKPEPVFKEAIVNIIVYGSML